MKSFLAPIDKYSNLPFRLLCQKYGAEAVCVPFVQAPAVVRGKEQIDAMPEERNLGLQVVGAKGEEVGRAALLLYKRYPFIKWLNINCGCPSVRTRNCGGGSALLYKPEEIKKALAIMRRADALISVKIRILEDRERTLALCKRLDVDFIIVHGRRPEEFYTGRADWEVIKYLKENLEVPVIGNGDLKSALEGWERVRAGYCDGFMIARAAMSNPAVFSNSRPRGMFKEYLRLCERFGMLDLKDLKMKAIQFSKGLPNSAHFRERAASLHSLEELLSLCEEFRV